MPDQNDTPSIYYRDSMDAVGGSSCVLPIAFLEEYLVVTGHQNYTLLPCSCFCTFREMCKIQNANACIRLAVETHFYAKLA